MLLQLRHALLLSCLWIFGAAVCLLFSVLPAAAMLDSTDHSPPPLHIAEAFGLQTPALGGWWDQADNITADEIATSVPANVLTPGVPLTAKFQVKNAGSEPIATHGFIEVRRYEMATVGDDVFKYEIHNLGVVGKVPVSVSVAAGSVSDLSCTIPIPARFGGYALIMDLGPKGGRHLVGLCIRTFKMSSDRSEYPVLTLDERDHTFLDKIGVHAIRTSIVYKPTTAADFPQYIADMKKNMDDLKARHITCMVLFQGNENEYTPLGMWAHGLNDKDQMTQGGTDTMWMPSYDPDFSKFVKIICARYGYPRGPISATYLYNEPWEGGSISGWQSDLPRYREAYAAMAKGVLEARREDHAQVLVGGTDSTTNAMDKLFGDGKTTFLPVFDFVSMHYQGLDSYTTYPLWHDRTGPLGRVRFWDTESWVANTDERIASQIASWRAAGYDRIMGVDANMTCDVRPVQILSPNGASTQKADGSAEQVTLTQPSSVAAAEASMAHFLGNRPFQHILFRNGLPWVFVFGGLPGSAAHPNPEDGTVVVSGDILAGDKTRFRTVESLAGQSRRAELRREIATAPPVQQEALLQEIEHHTPISDARMILAANSRYVLYDYYGNPQPSVGGKIVIPLNAHGYFLRGNGQPGSFSALTLALQKARIEGLEPVEIIAHDMTSPLQDHPELRLSLTNILNRPVQGRLTAHLGGVTLNKAFQELTLGPNETKEVAFRVMEGRPAFSNTYPFKAVFAAGSDGTVTHTEPMHCNVVAHRTITVDGDLSDWAGVIPQNVAAGSTAPSLTEQAWYPGKSFSAIAAGSFAVAYLAYDAHYFYFAAKVAGSTPDPGTLRFATRDDDAAFFPDTVYVPNNQTASQYSARWTGRVTPKYSETYTFTTTSDDGVRLWVDGKPIVDNRTDHGPTDDSGIIALKAGQSYDIKMEYFNDAGGGTAKLSWQSASQPKEIVPASALTTADAQPGGLTAQYSTGIDLANFTEKQAAPAIDFEWADGAGPIEGTAKTGFRAIQWPKGVRHYIYRGEPSLPAGNGNGSTDNIQIAFNVIPESDAYDKKMYPFPAGTMPHYIGFKDTDYEYALNQVAPKFGGGTEIWRLLTVGMPVKTFYPRQGASPFDGPVKAGKLVIKQAGTTRITEAAIPWSEMPWVKRRLDAGQTVKFSFRVNDANGTGYELAHDRSVSQVNSQSFHNPWVGNHWSNELEFGFEKHSGTK
ncbi:MAG: PA14 domain-containing protein [Janthinobacterium lividum]